MVRMFSVEKLLAIDDAEHGHAEAGMGEGRPESRARQAGKAAEGFPGRAGEELHPEGELR